MNSLELKRKFRLFLTMVVMAMPAVALGATDSSSMYSSSSNQISTNKVYPPDYWEYSHTPLLSQLTTVNQINLQPGVHLFDVDLSVSRSAAESSVIDGMGMTTNESQNIEGLLKVRYAVPITRYFYVGTTLGYAGLNELEKYDQRGFIDPDVFAGYHIPWQNGNFRLGLTFSPSLGSAVTTRTLRSGSDHSTGNHLRGGMSIRPEAGFTVRAGVAILGLEASYLHLDNRTQQEELNLSNEVLNDPDFLNAISMRYFGVPGANALSQIGSSYSSNYNLTIKNTISGGDTWSVKALIEFPQWGRLGGELTYGVIAPVTVSNAYGLETSTRETDFQQVKAYFRVKANDEFSITPAVSWIPKWPNIMTPDRYEESTNVVGLQVTLRSKFSL